MRLLGSIVIARSVPSRCLSKRSFFGLLDSTTERLKSRGCGQLTSRSRHARSATRVHFFVRLSFSVQGDVPGESPGLSNVSLLYHTMWEKRSSATMALWILSQYRRIERSLRSRLSRESNRRFQRLARWSLVMSHRRGGVDSMSSTRPTIVSMVTPSTVAEISQAQPWRSSGPRRLNPALRSCVATNSTSNRPAGESSDSRSERNAATNPTIVRSFIDDEVRMQEPLE